MAAGNSTGPLSEGIDLLAVQYGSTNGGGVSSGGVGFESQWGPDDTIVVHAQQSQPSYLARIFGIGSQDVGAVAKARSEAPAEAKFVAPIGVDRSHPLLSGSGCPCFDQPTTLDLQMVGPGAFRLLNVDGSRGGTGPGYGSFISITWDGVQADPGSEDFGAHTIQLVQ